MVDLEKLDRYLSSEHSPKDSLHLSDLDGFLTGVLCSPDLIMPSEWLSVVWGKAEPVVTDIDKHIWATQEVLGRYNEIAKMLNCERAYLEPIFWQAPEGHTIAMDWCEGFNDAIQLRTSHWDNFLNSQKGQEWFYPIRAHLFDKDGVSLAGVEEEKLDAILDDCAAHIPEVIPLIFAHWLSKRR